MWQIYGEKETCGTKGGLVSGWKQSMKSVRFYFDSRAHQYKAKPHAKSVEKFKKRMKELTCRSWGVSNSYKVEKLHQLI